MSKHIIMSRNIWFPTSVDLHEPVQPPVKLRNSKWCSVSSLTVRIFKRLVMALIRVHAGWSESLLVAHTTLLEISCTGSYDSGTYCICTKTSFTPPMMSYIAKLGLDFGLSLHLHPYFCVYNQWMLRCLHICTDSSESLLCLTMQ